MKNLFFILITTITISCAGSKHTAGIDDSNIPINTSVIFVQTDIDADAEFKNVVNALQRRGYTFRLIEENYKTISTDFRGVSQRWGVDNTFVRISVSIQGEDNSKIAVRGWYKTLENENSETGQTVKKFGQNGSPTRDAWKEVYEFARSLGENLEFQ
jgi:hypothetical protein